MYGWGAMNPTAIKEAVKAEFPMDKFISIWWPNDADAASAGDGAKGFKMLNWHGDGRRTTRPSPTSRSSSSTRARARRPKDEFGQVLYDRGVYNSVLIAEAIAEAQKITGKKVVTGEDVRRGLENLNLDAARFKALGLDGFAGPLKTTCADHNSHSRDLRPAVGRVEMGEGQRPHRPRHGQGPAAARRGRQGLRREERRLAQRAARLCDNK